MGALPALGSPVCSLHVNCIRQQVSASVCCSENQLRTHPAAARRAAEHSAPHPEQIRRDGGCWNTAQVRVYAFCPAGETRAGNPGHGTEHSADKARGVRVFWHQIVCMDTVLRKATTLLTGDVQKNPVLLGTVCCGDSWSCARSHCGPSSASVSAAEHSPIILQSSVCSTVFIYLETHREHRLHRS